MKRWSLVVVGCVCALTAVSTSVAAKPKPKPKPKPLPTCAKLLPLATANAVTGNAYALTKIVAKSSPQIVSCEYDNASWPGPQGTAGALSLWVQPANARTRGFFALVNKTYAKSAAHSAATAERCQAGYQPAPLADQCQILRPFGANSIEFVGYMDILTSKYMVNVSRGGADYTPEGLQAIARTVLARLH